MLRISLDKLSWRLSAIARKPDQNAPSTLTLALRPAISNLRLTILARLSQLVDKIGYSTSKNASPIKGGNPKTWRSEDQVA